MLPPPETTSASDRRTASAISSPSHVVETTAGSSPVGGMIGVRSPSTPYRALVQTGSRTAPKRDVRHQPPEDTKVRLQHRLIAQVVLTGAANVGDDERAWTGVIRLSLAGWHP